MRNAVINDMKDYGKKHGRLMLLSFILVVLCFGFLAFSSNIRIDTEELMNEPGSSLGWLTIGRYSLVLFKRLLGLGTHSAFKSGLRFLLFFWMGANLLTFAFYSFSGKDERYPYWVFVLLYCTSNIWCYQIYFSLQQAEIALAMLLVIVAACLSVTACLGRRGWHGVMCLFAATGLLVLGLGAYQALATFYIAVCISLFLVQMEYARRRIYTGDKGCVDGTDQKAERGQATGFLVGAVELALQFGMSYLIYSWIADTWFMATEGYMQNQKGWGRMSVADCIHSVLLTGKNVLLGYGPRNFSFYTAGVLLMLIVVIYQWKKRRFPSKGWFFFYLLALAGLLFSPFMMTLYMGEMLVTRSQFALPVTAAFLGMFGLKNLPRKNGKGWRIGYAIAVACVAVTVVIQAGYDLRLAHTDDVRQEQDEALTQEVLKAIKETNNGEMPEVPVVFVGYVVPEYDDWCVRTEMYGWSFYEWDYSVTNPTGATHRIDGFLQAYTGERLKEDVSEKMQREAVALAEDMPDFPAEGSVRMTENFMVVRLSEIRERTDLTWR